MGQLIRPVLPADDEPANWAAQAADNASATLAIAAGSGQQQGDLAIALFFSVIPPAAARWQDFTTVPEGEDGVTSGWTHPEGRHRLNQLL